MGLDATELALGFPIFPKRKNDSLFTRNQHSYARALGSKAAGLIHGQYF